MLIIFILIAFQCAFLLAAVYVLKKFWDRELIRAALEEFETCPASPEIKEIGVRCAVKIPDEFKSRIESIHRRKFTQANLNMQEDKSLRGGIVITVGGLSLDFSLSGS